MGLVMLATLLLAGMAAALLSFGGLIMPVKRHARAAAFRTIEHEQGALSAHFAF